MKTYEVILKEITDYSSHPDINNPEMKERVKQIQKQREAKRKELEARRKLEATNREKTRADISSGKAPNVQVGKGGSGLGTALFNQNLIKKENMEFRDFMMLQEETPEERRKKIEAAQQVALNALKNMDKARAAQAAYNAKRAANNSSSTTPSSSGATPSNTEKQYGEKDWREVGEYGRHKREIADATRRGEAPPAEPTKGSNPLGQAARQVGDRLGGANNRWQRARGSNLNQHGWKHISGFINKAIQRNVADSKPLGVARSGNISGGATVYKSSI